ncbi:MAG: DUF4349 domain-containing protein [Oscillospiraceae bacterium]|nr:DUF4349 domain-containing protein [Oscillospiraceae bacterium]
MKLKKTFVLLLSLLMLLSLCACGSASSNKSEGYYRSDSTAAAVAEEPMAPDEAYYDGEEYGGFAAAAEGKAMDEGTPEAAQIDPEKIIYSADATVETTEFELTLEKLEALVKQVGGFVESSSINGSNYYSQSRGYNSNRSAYYRIRIPSGRFNELMGSLSTLGNVPYSSTYSENITSRYYDVQARLTAYQTQEQRLLEMMEMAETVSDLIVIEDRLTELRYEIESLQSTLNNWDRQVNYSSVSVSVNEVSVYTPEAKLSYGERLGLAIRSGLQNTADFFSEFLLWFLEALPALIILAVIVVVVVILVRRSVKKRRARKADEK